MRDRDQPNGHEAAAPGEEARGRPARSAYEPPRILFREPLETLAAVCVPAPPAKGSPGACPSGPISS